MNKDLFFFSIISLCKQNQSFNVIVQDLSLSVHLEVNLMTPEDADTSANTY